jgi:glucosamine--fructose-6-phosphate aminotransferase (isomerizing)
MCGIVGYIGSKNATEVVLNGLQRVEYRGYDSAGIAFFDRAKALNQNKKDKNQISIFKKSGRLSQLTSIVDLTQNFSNIAIGHTR